MKKARFLLLPFVLLIVSGCISLPGGDKNAPPADIYTLHAPQAAKAGVAAKTGVVVAVPKPEVPPGFGTERIALQLEQGRRLDYYANAKWSARLEDLLQQFIIQTARQSLPGKIFDTPDLAKAARYKMVVKVTDFQAVYPNAPDTPPRLDVAMTVTVLALPGEAVKTQFTLSRQAQASANTMTAVTQGLESLLQSVTAEAVQKLSPSLTVASGQ
jgi:ABC-type uncharacterized transport system auxiliary subunit